MSKAHETWTVLQHGPLEKITPKIWCVEGRVPGPPFPRRMTIVKLTRGRLIIHSAIALQETLMKEIEFWGTPTFLLVPGMNHRLDAKIFKNRYRQLNVLCPPGAKKQIEKVITVDKTSVDFGDPDITWAPLEGTAERESVLIVRTNDDTTLILNDALMNMAPQAGLQGFIFNLLGFTGPAKLPPLPKMRLVKDRRELREHFMRLASLPKLSRIIMSHGAIISRDAPAILRRFALSI